MRKEIESETAGNTNIVGAVATTWDEWSSLGSKDNWVILMIIK
jgi:hypothetical protein